MFTHDHLTVLPLRKKSQMVGSWAYWLEIEILGLGERPPGSQGGGLNGGQKESRSGCTRVLQGPTWLCAWYITACVKGLSLDLDSLPGLCMLTASAPGQPWCSRPFTSFHKKFNHTILFLVFTKIWGIRGKGAHLPMHRIYSIPPPQVTRTSVSLSPLPNESPVMPHVCPARLGPSRFKIFFLYLKPRPWLLASSQAHQNHFCLRKLSDQPLRR